MRKDYTEDDLTFIGYFIEIASEKGLLEEVIYYSLKSMKEDNSQSVVNAFMVGYKEWIK